MSQSWSADPSNNDERDAAKGNESNADQCGHVGVGGGGSSEYTNATPLVAPSGREGQKHLPLCQPLSCRHWPGCDRRTTPSRMVCVPLTVAHLRSLAMPLAAREDLPAARRQPSEVNRKFVGAAVTSCSDPVVAESASLPVRRLP